MWDEPAGWTVDLDRRFVHVYGVGDIHLPSGSVWQLRRMVGRGGEPRTLTITRHRAGGRKANRQVAREHRKVTARADNWAREGVR